MKLITGTAVIRWVVSAALAYGVYLETGPLTCAFAVFTMTGVEVSALLIRGIAIKLTEGSR